MFSGSEVWRSLHHLRSAHAQCLPAKVQRPGQSNRTGGAGRVPPLIISIDPFNRSLDNLKEHKLKGRGEMEGEAKYKILCELKGQVHSGVLLAFQRHYHHLRCGQMSRNQLRNQKKMLPENLHVLCCLQYHSNPGKAVCTSMLTANSAAVNWDNWTKCKHL